MIAHEQAMKERALAEAIASAKDLSEPIEMYLSNTHSNVPGFTVARFTTELPGESYGMYSPNNIDFSVLVPSESLRGYVSGDKVTITVNWD